MIGSLVGKVKFSLRITHNLFNGSYSILQTLAKF
jgi:hypothetical protein